MEKIDIEKQFGTTIRKWRERTRLSQEDLAKRAGLHRTYVCDIERGARNVSLKNVQRLAEGLSIPIPSLFADLDVKTSAAPMVTDQMVDILVVEDNVNDVTLTMQAFKNWGVTNRIYVVNDGVQALDFLFCTGNFSHHRPTDQPQVILLDLHLPKIDGLEVLRRIKSDPRTSAIPVIVLTGSKDSRDISECKRLGVENYILKPLDFQSFSDVSLHLHLQWALMKPAVAACS
ncbi:MAG TPA: response regulator [Verrucomicrobiae bacterium]|nr:response regulator [Verrucomicrobiae bacterium]